MKKKIMAVTLCLAMVSTFAVGCGQKNETDSGKSEEKSSGKVEIEFVQVKREAAESYTKVIEAFEKENPDIVIKQNVVPDAQEVLMTRASSDSLPDMMNHWPTDAQFVQFEDEGLLLDLSEKDYMKNIDSKYLDAVKAKDGKNYIAPYNVNFMGVYYNKDICAIRRMIENGVNLIDTAPCYGNGTSEKIVGEVLKEIPREQVLISTKFGLIPDIYTHGYKKDTSYKNAMREIQSSLMNLETDYIDFYFVHWPDVNTPIDETMAALEEMKRKGYIRYVGVSNFTAEQIKEAEQYIQIDVQQPLYSMVDRGFEDLMSWGYDRGIDSMTYGSMGAGILSGKIRSVPSFEKNDLRLNFYDVYKEPKFSKIMELLKVMDSIADGHNVPVGQVALNWSTQKEYVGTALVGVRSIEHADENCKTFDWKLTEEEMKILDSKIEECAL